MALKELVNEVIEGLKTDGVFALGDCLYVRGVHTGEMACQNWIKNAHNSTLINSPTFTPKVGITGDGSTSHINNNYNLKTESVNYNLTDATIAYMMSAHGTNGTFNVTLGTRQTVGAIAHTVMRIYTAATDRLYFNAESQLVFTAVDGNYYGFTRAGNNNSDYINGAFSHTEADTADSILADLSMCELCANNDEIIATRSNGTICFSFYGAGLDADKQLALYTRIKYFFDNVGGTF